MNMVAEVTQGAEGGPGGALVELRDLVKHYRLRHHRRGRQTVRTIRAVDGVTFSIHRQSTFGLVGESGCGKSTLGRLLLRLEKPTSGQVTFDGGDWLAGRGQELRRARKDVQAIFQDPLGSLDPRHRVVDVVSEALEAHGVIAGKRERHDRSLELLESVGLRAEVAKRYPRELSGGQRQRVTIARAISVDPKFLVCDEAVSSLDVSVQAQVVNLLDELQETLGISYLFISHGLATVRHVADEIGVMYLGRLVERAPADELFSSPAHPYTGALLAAAPVPDPAVGNAGPPLRGEVPSATDLPSGCRFRLRCPRAEAICAEVEPEMVQCSPAHEVACHFPMSSPVPLRRPGGLAVDDRPPGGAPGQPVPEREEKEAAR
jgi:oligopeptide/dipeptide ABC transporter ATP-binding protein